MAVLGHVSAAGYGLAQGLQQLVTCLRRSTEQGLYWAAGEDVDPSQLAATHLSVTAAAKSLTTASRRAEQWGELAGRARRELVAEATAVEVRLNAHLSQRRVAVGARLAQVPTESAEGWYADREWLTLQEAADLASISVNTLKNARWRRDYGGPVAHRDATDQRRMIFRRDEVLAFRQQRLGAA